MIPIKHQKRPEGTTGADLTRGREKHHTGEYFNNGAACAYARYMIEMSFKHPIMYLLFFHWWIPSLLHKDEYDGLDPRWRPGIKTWVKQLRKTDYKPYWAEFSLYHPIQFLVFLLAIRIFQGIVKFLTGFIKVISRFQSTAFKNSSTNL